MMDRRFPDSRIQNNSNFSLIIRDRDYIIYTRIYSISVLLMEPLSIAQIYTRIIIVIK